MALVPTLDLRPKEAEASAVQANIEAEQAIIGILLYQNEAYHLLDDLEPWHFYEPFHGRLFSALSARIGAGKLADATVLDAEFRADPGYVELGGVRYLADLVDRAPPGRNLPDYAAAVVDEALRRELGRIGKEAEARASDYTENGRAQVEAIESSLFGLSEEKKGSGGFHDFGDALDGAVAMAEAAASRSGDVSGISTGLIDLDRKLGGMHPSDLLIIAARPSIGKTALATNIAFSAARAFIPATQPDGSVIPERGARVGFFSLEMSKEQLAARVLAEVSGVSGDKMRKGEITMSDLGAIREARDLIRRTPLNIDDTGGLGIFKLCARARRLKRTKGLDLLVVDYLQLATGSEKSKGQGRVQEVSEITAALKALAKELSIPVLALAQLSRNVEARDDKRPQLSDLRESGSIEQDADVVMFIYREEYYLGRAEPKEGTKAHIDWEVAMDAAAGVAEVIIGKQRHGPIGTVRLAFEGATTKFGNAPQPDRYGAPLVALPYAGDRD